MAMPRPASGGAANRISAMCLARDNVPEDNPIEWWDAFVNEFYDPKAKMSLTFSTMGEDYTKHVFEPSRSLFAQLFQLWRLSGLRQEHIAMENPMEFQLASGHVLIESTKAVWICSYGHSTVVRYGNLRVMFRPNLKITLWQFRTERTEETVDRSVIKEYQKRDIGSPPSPVNTFGLTPPISRFALISEVVQELSNVIRLSLDSPSMKPTECFNFLEANRASSIECHHQLDKDASSNGALSQGSHIQGQEWNGTKHNAPTTR